MKAAARLPDIKVRTAGVPGGDFSGLAKLILFKAAQHRTETSHVEPRRPVFTIIEGQK